MVVDTAGGAALEGTCSLAKKGQPSPDLRRDTRSEDRAKGLGITARGAGARGTELFTKIVEPIAAGKPVAEDGKIFPLVEAAAARKLSQTGHGRGRVLPRV